MAIRADVGVQGLECRRALYRAGGAVVGDVVVVQITGSTERGGNVVRAARYRLTCGAAVAGSDIISSQEVIGRASCRERGVSIAVGLALGVRGAGGVTAGVR